MAPLSMKERIPDWILDLIPGEEDTQVLFKLRELQRQAGTLPKIFSFLVAAYIAAESQSLPIPFIADRHKILLVAFLIGVAYVYDDKKRRATEAAQKAKNTITEQIEKGSQSQIDDYN